MEKKSAFVENLKNLVSNIWYLVAVVAVCIIVIMLIVNWGTTLAFLGKLLRVLMPFIVGFLFAYLISPFMQFILKYIEKIKPGKAPTAKRGIALGIAYMIVIGAITFIVIYIAPQISQSMRELSRTVQRGYILITRNPQKLQQWYPFGDVTEVMGDIKDKINDLMLDNGTKLFPYLYQISSSVFGVVYNAFFGLVISIYIVWEKNRLGQSLWRIVSAFATKENAKKIWETALNCNHIFNGFIYGKAIDSLIIGIITFIAMSVLGLPYALLLSVIVCITNMIPYFGPLIGAIPGVLIYLFIDPMRSLEFAILILCVQQFDGWYLGPKILGDLTGIKPLWVIFGITVGGAYFGALGMFLGVPTVAVIMYLGEVFLDYKREKTLKKEASQIRSLSDENDMYP